MIYGSRQGSEWDFHEIKSDVFRVCVFHAAACVTSFPDYSNLGDKDYEGVFANYDLNQYQGGMCISGVLKTAERTTRHLISPLGPNWVGTDIAV